jgi:hypothetical protein
MARHNRHRSQLRLPLGPLGRHSTKTHSSYDSSSRREYPVIRPLIMIPQARLGSLKKSDQKSFYIDIALGALLNAE